jgi:dTDP-glucose 4,6-dehydratase
MAHTTGLWDELRGQRLFITGGTGFFGCWLLESFAWANEKLDLGAQALVLSRDPAAFAIKFPHLAGHPAIRFHPGDVRTFDFPAGHFSHVIHAATPSSVPEAPRSLIDTIVQGTARTLDFAKQCGARKVLFTSSGAVYGQQPATITHVPEDFAGAPDLADVRSAYGEGKRLAELLCAVAAQESGLEVKIARCFAFVGPYLPLDVHFAIGNFIRDGLAGKPIRVNGDGTPYRSYLYAADLAIWLWTIFFSGVSCHPYNVGSEAAISIAELAETVASMFGAGISVDMARKAKPGHPPERYVPGTQRAQRELGLKTLIDLQEGIRRTIAWYASPDAGEQSS